jgi:sortase A
VELSVRGQGRPTSYRIEWIRVVAPGDVSVLEPTDRPSLTLVTCHPFYFVGNAPDRYVVRAVAAP